MTMKEEKQTVVNHIYGFQFNGCQMSNPTFQTVVRGDMNDGERVDDSPEASPEPEADDSPIPEVLLTDGAARLLERLQGAGLLDGQWRPLGLSGTEKGVLAALLSNRLGIDNRWQTFAPLWGMKPETLRSAYNKGLDQKRTGDFMDRVKKVMG